MEEEALQVRYLIVFAAVLCALIIGYNAFYVPDASMSVITVSADASSAVSGEEYTPSAPENTSSLSDTGSNATVKPAGSVNSQKPKSSAASGKININTATAQQLSDGLDGVGEVMAKRIVEYREKNGRFKSIQELKNVQGIGDKKFENIKNHITVD